MKLPAIQPPIKDSIKNQYSTIIINQKDPILPPLLAKYPIGYKPFFFNDTHFSNKTEDKNKDSTDN